MSNPIGHTGESLTLAAAARHGNQTARITERAEEIAADAIERGPLAVAALVCKVAKNSFLSALGCGRRGSSTGGRRHPKRHTKRHHPKRRHTKRRHTKRRGTRRQ